MVGKRAAERWEQRGRAVVCEGLYLSLDFVDDALNFRRFGVLVERSDVLPCEMELFVVEFLEALTDLVQ